MLFPARLITGMVLVMAITISHAQVTGANHGLSVNGGNVQLGGTLLNQQAAIDFGNGNSSSNFLLKKGSVNYLAVANNGTVTLGDGNAPAEHVIYYTGSATNGGRGVKFVNANSGSLVRLHSLSNGLYVTKDDGSPSSLIADNFMNAHDGSGLRATSGRWEINSGIFTVNQWWTGLGQYEMTIGDAARKGIIVKSAPSQTGNLMEWRNSSGNLLSFMNSSGGLGVGVDGLVTKLTVRSTSNNDGLWIAGPGATNVALLNNTTISAWNALSQVGDNLLLWKGSAPDNSDAGGLVLGTWSNSASGIRIASTGNVGIGVADPGLYKLAVQGTIGARKVIVTQASWADFVFEKDYSRPTLAEVEEFIQKNKHLPGVPSTKEIEKNGLDISETQAILLQKIEELTLYIIEQKKVNDSQQKRIEELEQQFKKRKN